MKRTFILGLLGGLMGSALLLIVLSAEGIVGARDAEGRSDIVRTNEVSATTIVTSTFTYQGQLISSGSPVSNTCDFQFSLYDALNNGNRIGITQTVSSVSVTRGLFTALLNTGNEFGGTAFNGDARWLAIAVRCPAGGGNYAALNPRQPLTSAPYALYSIGNWGLNGNSGTSANNFLGTTDNTMLTLGASNTAVLRLIPAPFAPIMIGGYAGNTVGGAGDGATIAGGGSSYWGANIISGTNVTWATIGGGVINQISGNAYQATIGGGYWNVISGSLVDRATIGGGNGNVISAAWATIGGGTGNKASGSGAFIGGGGGYRVDENISLDYRNLAQGIVSTIGGGMGNTASGYLSAIGGGWANTASGQVATVPGGTENTAGGYSSLAAGTFARALHDGTFVWGDKAYTDFASTGDNQFLIRARGGVGVNTNAPARSLDVNGVIGVFDGGTRTYYGGLATEVGGQLVELGINDDATNRFGGVYSSTAQGGLFRVDARANQDLFQFYGRAAGSTSGLNLLASLNTAGVLKIGGLGSAGATSLCLNGSNQIASCSSSVRFKDNIAALNLGLDVIAKLQPVTFNWKDSGQADLGFVAEDVNQVSSLLTTLNKNGQIEGVKYDRISAVLVKAVQEQQAQIATLQAQNTALQNQTVPPFNLFNLMSVIAFVGFVRIWFQQRRSKRGQA